MGFLEGSPILRVNNVYSDKSEIKAKTISSEIVMILKNQ